MGGAERQMVRLLRGLCDGPYRPLLVLKRFEGPLAEQVGSLGVPVLELGFRKLQSPDGYRAARKLRNLLEREEVAILQSYIYGGHFLGGWALDGLGPWAPGRRPRHVVCIRGHALPWPFLFKPLYRAVGKRASAVVTVSDDLGRTASSWGIPSSLLVTIPNAVPLPGPPAPGERQRVRAELGIPEEIFAVGVVGNLRAGKGHEDLLRAMALLEGGPSAARLLLIGEGEARGELEGLADRLGIASSVAFAGHRDDVDRILLALDLFAFPSHAEGMPNALLEAMAAGLPCLASDIPVHREILGGDPPSGDLVPPKDPEALAGALRRILAMDREERDTMGRRARERVESRYTVPRMLERYLGLYARLLSGEASAARR
jgi:glycosyltransferase involved in cell wall biosynthesis